MPPATFEALDCTTNLYFSRSFLIAFETCNSLIRYHYLLLKNLDGAAALVILQEMDVPLDNATEKLPLPERMARSLQCYLSERRAHILVCGNIFLSGRYGIFIKEGIDKKEIYDTVAKQVKHLKTKRKASVFFFKDFCNKDFPFVNVIQHAQFEPFTVEPNMRMTIYWSHFESYKESLKSKYRVKVNKADKRSKDLVVQNLDVEDLKQHLNSLEILYQNITDKAGFNALNFSIQTYISLKESFRESVYIKGYWLKEDLVGFAAAFYNQDTVDAHYIGINYDLNKAYALYPRILNDYIRLAIELKASELNLGRTASEIKSTVGAIPEELTCYVKHRRTVANLIFKPLIRQIKMTEFKQHVPFKQKT